MGSTKTQVYSKGALGSDSGYVYRYNFPDTASANLGFLKNVSGIVILAGDFLWKRNSTAVKWEQLGGTGGSGGPTTVVDLPTDTYPDGGRINGTDLELNKVGYRNPGMESPRDKRRTDRGFTQVVQSGVVCNNNTYAAFSSATPVLDTLFVAYPEKYNHVDNGKLVLKKTVNGGASFDSIGLLHTNANNVVIGHVGGDTILFNYDRGGSSIYNYFGYTTNGFRTFTITDSLDFASFTTLFFDKFLKLPNGDILLPYYNFDGGTNYLVGCIRSTDGGLHWAAYTTIVSGAVGAVDMNEVSWDIINDPTTVGNTRIFVAVRDEQLGGHRAYVSGNGGATWSYIGLISQFDSSDDDAGFPLYVIYYFGKVRLVGGRRTNFPGVSTAPFYKLDVSDGDPEKVFLDPVNFSTPRTIHRFESSYSGRGNWFDCGYPTPAIYAGSLVCFPYDISPHMEELDDTTRTTIQMLKINGTDGFECYNSTNQTISVNTDTKVQFPIVFIDANGSYLSDSYIVPATQSYHVEAEITYQPNNTGTYRSMWIVVRNPGVPASDRIIQGPTVQATDNQLFLKMRLSVPIYLRVGERVEVYTRHDGSSTEELRNQNETKYRAKFSIKKIEQ